MRRTLPPVGEVRRELIRKKSWIESKQEVDVRLQVLEDGRWSVRTGDASMDQDTRGYWGCSSMNLRTNCEELAKELIDQAREAIPESKDWGQWHEGNECAIRVKVPKLDSYPNNFECEVQIWDKKTGIIHDRIGLGKFIGNFSPIWVSFMGHKKQIEVLLREGLPTKLKA